MKKGKNRLIEEYRSTLKSMDTEETFDLIFYRPLGYLWALAARKAHVTPNVITIASIFLGVGAGIMIYFDNFWYNLAGIFLLVWANTFDSADGQLARMTHQYSRIGRILDGVSGDLWFAAIYIAICLRENDTSAFFATYPWLIWLAAVVTGWCHATQASMADCYRQLHLYFVKGEAGSELENSDKLREKFDSLTWRHDFMAKLVMMFYLNYTVGQEKRTPALQKFRRLINSRFHGHLPERLRADFRAAGKPLMKYTNILSFNTRSFALMAAVLIFQMPWLYFAFELTVLNILLVYMMVRHEHICKTFINKIEDGEY